MSPGAAVLIVLLAVPAPSFAEGLTIQPGRWEFTATTPNPLGGAPDRRTSNDCVTDEEMKPQFFVARMQGCTVSDTRSDATTMAWTISCPSQAGRMTGKGSFRSTGTAMSGWVEVLLNVNGASYSSKSSWEGRRTGDCQ
jgi:hypothetical protein